MPSFVQHSSPSVSPLRTGFAELKMVGFSSPAVSSISRPLNNTELWALYNFEMHARSCSACNDPYAVYKSGNKLCSAGRRLAHGVTDRIYSKHDGVQTYSATETDRTVLVEIPAGYYNVRRLLRATESKARHRTQKPVISYEKKKDSSSKRPPVEKTKTEKAHPRQTIILTPSTTKHRERSRIIEPTQRKAIPTSIDPSYSRQHAYPAYVVEVREPSRRSHRTSAFYS